MYALARGGGGHERAYDTYTHIKWRKLDVIPNVTTLLIMWFLISIVLKEKRSNS